MQALLETIRGGKARYKPPTSPMVLGEAPIYRASDSTLHWVDALKEPPELHVLKVDPESGDAIGEVKGSYICAYYGGVAFMDEETENLEALRQIIPKEMRAERRFNDGGIDAKGRFWLAEIDKRVVAYGLGLILESYGEPKGRLWRYNPDGSLHEMASGFICGNGVDWSPDKKTFYINDSVEQKSYAFFDLETRNISNKRFLVDLNGTSGEPDGLMIDAEGNIWMAVYGSSQAMIFYPNGKHLKDIEFSAKNMTCPTWGEKNLDVLFLNSAKDGILGVKEGDEGGNVS